MKTAENIIAVAQRALSAVSPTASRRAQPVSTDVPSVPGVRGLATRDTAGWAACATTRAFSLLEIMVAVGLLAVIIVGLLAMFYQVQRAFRGGTAQVDVMENGRAGTSLIVREAQEAIALQLEPLTNMGVVLPVLNAASDAAPAFGSLQTLPGGDPNRDKRQNFLRDFYFMSKLNDEWIGTSYRISNAISGVGTLYRLTERQTTNNPWFLASNLARATPYNNTNFRRVMDGVVHFTIDMYDTNGLILLPADNAYPPALGYAVTNGMLPAYIDVEMALLEPVPLEKFRYRYDVNPVQATTYLANQASRTHVFRQRIPIRPGRTDYNQ